MMRRVHNYGCWITTALVLFLLRKVTSSGNVVSGENAHSYEINNEEMPKFSFASVVPENDSCSMACRTRDDTAFCYDRYNAAMIQAITMDHDLSKARHEALQAVQAGCDEHVVAELYQKHADNTFFFHHPTGSIDPVLNDASTTTTTTRDSSSNSNCSSRVQPFVDREGCWNFVPDSEQEFNLWEECCSLLFWDGCLDRRGTFFKNMRHVDGMCVRKQQRMCCEFHNRTFSYLHLPVLRELALRIRVGTDQTGVYESYNLEQDGFLRKFDTSTILWPAGYLLTLCISAPKYCGIPELQNALLTYNREQNDERSQPHPKVLELAAGIGAPSIAMARWLRRMIGTTEAGMVILALIESNAVCANASVSTARLDYLDWSSVMEFREQVQTRFNAILGAALIIDPDTNQTEKLWKLLDALLDWSDRSVVVLVHTIGLLLLPADSGFQLIRSISGDRFNMKTRWGNTSEFEISVYQRSQQAIQ